MKNPLILLTLLTVLSACSAPNSPEAIGEHNLSKGKCTDIPDNNRPVSDEMVQNACQMVGGQFVPRNHLKRRWF